MNAEFRTNRKRTANNIFAWARPNKLKLRLTSRECSELQSEYLARARAEQNRNAAFCANGGGQRTTNRFFSICVKFYRSAIAVQLFKLYSLALERIALEDLPCGH